MLKKADLTYNPAIFDVNSIAEAKKIILTPEKNMNTEKRWQEETPFIVNIIGQELKLNDKSLIVDYGCGIGRISKQLIEHFGCQVVGVDISSSMRSYAINYVNSEKFSVYSHKEFKKLLESNFKADHVISIWVLQHCQNVIDDIRLIDSVLNQNGKLLIVNNIFTCIPTVSGWFDNELNIWHLISEKLNISKIEKIPEGIASDELRNNSLIGVFKKNKNNKEKNIVTDDLLDDLYNQAQNYHQMGNLKKSILLYEILNICKNSNAEIVHYLGLAKYQIGHYQEGIKLMIESVNNNPENDVYINNLSKAYTNLCCYRDAEKLLKQAIENNGFNIKQLNDLGKVYVNLKKIDEAEECYRKVLDIEKNNAEAYFNLGDLYKNNHNKHIAIDYYKKAYKLEPNNSSIINNLGVIYAAYGEHKIASKYFLEAIKKNYKDIKSYSNFLFNLNYQTHLSASEIYKYHKEFGEKYERDGRIFDFSKKIRKKEKIKIGYLSADFYQHSVSYFIESIFSKHNHERFEIYIYDDSPVHDEMTKRLESAVDVWRTISPLSDEEVARLIFKDEVDILVDLSGHTSRHNRLFVFIMKPAPIQVSYLGYPNTTGLTTIDYKISDKWTDPEGQTEKYYTEKILRLDSGFLCYSPQDSCPSIKESPFIKNKFITFASFNNFTKINDETIKDWAMILQSIEDSHLILKAKQFLDLTTKKEVIDKFKKFGIKHERLEFISWFDSYRDHMDYYNKVDIALDTFPYNGTTTTCEALWMGVPVITLAGDTHLSRVGVSILNRAGLSECICFSHEEYIKKSIEFAKNKNKLIKYKEELREKISKTTLINPSDIVHCLENSYEIIFQNEINKSHLKELIKQANDLLSKGKNIQAVDVYNEALVLDNDNAEVHHNIGIALSYLGYLEEAKNHLEITLSKHPDNAAVYLNLGNIIKDMGCYGDAIVYFNKAIELKPEYAEAENSLGLCWNGLGDQGNAVRHFKNAIRINPGLYQIHNNLGNTLLGLVKIDEAIKAFKTAINLQPNFYMAQSNYLYALLYQENIDRNYVFQEHVNWAKQFDSFKKYKFTNDIQQEKRIRIGYVSPDFWRHPVIFFIEGLFSEHDHEQFEIYAYDDTRCPDEMTKRIESRVDHWRRIRGCNDEDVYNLIQQDEVDILVDLAGHTAENRMHLFSMKPAPIQISYLGYPHSTGLPMIDYRFTDGNADPIEYADKYYSEKLIRLPDCFLCYQAPENCPEIHELPAIKNKYITFASFNNFVKVNKKNLQIWLELLHAIPDSHLLIKAKQLQDKDLCSEVLSFFKQHCISEERIELASWFSTYSEHMGFYNKVDIALDTFPYHGTTTTFEALYMGVPVISLEGDMHISRVGKSILSQLDLDEFVAKSATEYVNIGVKLAKNQKKLISLRNNLRNKLETSSLMDAKRFTNNIENEYKSIWSVWCENVIKNNENLKRRLHIGGKEKHPDWEILDIFPNEGVVHVNNAKQLNKFSDETFDEIYASHVLEHFDFAKGEINQVLKEWYRVLKNGGKLYISVPDMDKLCALFLRNTLNVNQKFEIIRMFFGGHINENDYHKVGFNKEILLAYLRDTGFSSVEIVNEFGIFRDTSTMYYDGVPISLNLIASK